MYPNRPQFLILDMGPRMVQLCEAINEYKLECFDKNSVLSQIVEAASYLPEASNEASDLRDQIILSDLLYTEIGESEPGAAQAVVQKIETIADQIGSATRELTADLAFRRLVEDDYFNYKFHRNVHDQTLVFSRVER